MFDINLALEVLGVVFLTLLAAFALCKFWSEFYKLTRSYKCDNMNTHTACDDNSICIHCRKSLAG